MKIRTGLVLTVLLALSLGVKAQGVKDIRINEVLVFNEDNYMDPYGHRVGWIELHNTGHGSVDVGGCHLTIYNEGQGEMYQIPKGDVRTIIPPEGYLLFYAEGTATKGTFHTNFTLDQTGYLAFYDQSGKGDPVHSITYKIEEQLPDVSIGLLKDQHGKPVLTKLAATTPMGTNEEQDLMPKSERFRMMDPYGIVMALTAIAVVFSALLFLYLVFRTIGKINMRAVRRKQAREEQVKNQAVHPVMPASGDVIDGEKLAAIAMALYQYQNDLHDIESNVVTINKVARAYSPWSSKIYGLRQTPNKK